MIAVSIGYIIYNQYYLKRAGQIHGYGSLIQYTYTYTYSSKGKKYALIKDNVNEANYLNILSCPASRTMLKFRTGNHKLPVEVGRWNNIELQERKCQLCQTSNIVDELHYLLECSFFQTERKSLIDQYYYKRPNILNLMNY